MEEKTLDALRGFFMMIVYECHFTSAVVGYFK